MTSLEIIRGPLLHAVTGLLVLTAHSHIGTEQGQRNKTSFIFILLSCSKFIQMVP